MRIFSFGGGVQSMAVLVLSAQGKLPYTHFIFANVGDDTENPETIEYVKSYAVPFAEKHGLYIIEVKREVTEASKSTLYKEVLNTKNFIQIPMFINGSPIKRACTSNWKIAVVNKFMRQYLNAKVKRKRPIGIGISLDEFTRMRTDNPGVTIAEYPLIDLRLTREDCIDIIKEAGLPEAPKSSCWFCPYKKTKEWYNLSKENKELFQKGVELEKELGSLFPNDKLTFSYKKLYLEELVAEYELKTAKKESVTEEDVNCETGYCMT